MGQIDFALALVTYFGFLVALTMHEAAQAFVGRYLGDKSPETEARATINPLPHVDLFGTVIFPLIMFMSGSRFLLGWAKPAIIDSRYFKKPRRDVNLVSLSGLGFNFLLAVICAIAIRQLGYGLQVEDMREPLPAILSSMAKANIMIGLFNVIPFPQSDSWRIIVNSVHYNTAQKLHSMQTTITIAMIALMLLGVFSPIFQFFLALFYAFIA